MIISRGRAFIFVHIPKTGGTSFALAYDDRAMKDDILIGDTPKARRRKTRLSGLTSAGRLWKHASLADIDGLTTPAELSAMQIATLVRNPWDRIVSYYHWLQTQSFDHPAVTLAQGTDFSTFLNAPATQVSLRSQPYARYLTDAAGVVHDSHMIRLEHFPQDAAPLFDHLGFTLALPQSNASARLRDWRSYYSDSDAALIGEICAADITRHGYRFEPTNN